MATQSTQTGPQIEPLDGLSYVRGSTDIPLSDATVYFDHPQHAQAEHTLNIDFLNPGRGPSARVAVELTAESARALVRAIEATLEATPPGLL